MLGILLIDKPLGLTSHDVVSRTRRALNTKRVGHAGTLDPLATGLLLVAVGHATRFLNYLPLEPKVYEAVFRFGQSTTTFDAEGEVTATAPVPTDLEKRINNALPQFQGEIQQVPPMYSAVKKAGKPLYTYARKGEDIERESRLVTLHEFNVTPSFSPESLPFLSPEPTPETADIGFTIVCSGGTYVRSLAHDLGTAIGVPAHLAALRRTAIGRFGIEDAIPLESITPEELWPLSDALPPLPFVPLNETQVTYVHQGRVIRVRELPPEPTVALTDPDGNVIAIAKATAANQLQPELVIPPLPNTPA